MTKPIKELSVDSEEWAHKEFVLWLKREYPNVIFRTDFAAGLHLPIWVAKKHAKLQSSKAFPDIFIFEPSRGYHGMGIEMKAPGARLKKQNGDWDGDHVRRQNAMLERLDDKGYAAYFAFGLEDAKTLTDWYFGKGDEFVSVGRVPVITKPHQHVVKVKAVASEAEEAF